MVGSVERLCGEILAHFYAFFLMMLDAWLTGMFSSALERKAANYREFSTRSKGAGVIEL